MKMLLSLLIAMCLTLPLAASPIIYTMTGTLSGTIGGVGFQNEPFTFVFDGDTTGVFDDSPTLLFNPVTASSLSITTIGSGDFTQALDVGVDSMNDSAGFADPTITDVLAAQNAGFAGWNLASSIGPLEQTGAAFLADGSFDTSLGTLDLIGATNVSFGAVAAVPEPATTGLIALSLVGVALRRRSRLAQPRQ